MPMEISMHQLKNPVSQNHLTLARSGNQSIALLTALPPLR